MRIVDVMQGTPEWEMARLGIPTASQADRILTPSRLKPAAAAREYLYQLLAEWLIGYPIEWSASSQYMQRGTDLEAEARAAYELEMGVDVQTTGLLLTDDGMFGGSPDGLVGDVGGLEIKCPAIHTHIGYLLDPESLADRYRGQVQALLWITRREWWDLWAYHPELPPVRVRVWPDAEWGAAWEPTLTAFVDELKACREKLREYKRIPPTVEAVLAAEAEREAESAAAGIVPGDLASLLGDAVAPSAIREGR